MKQNLNGVKKMPQRRAILQLIFYFRIQGEDARRVRWNPWWQIKGAEESTVGKSLGLDKKAEERNTCFFFTGGHRIVQN